MVTSEVRSKKNATEEAQVGKWPQRPNVSSNKYLSKKSAVVTPKSEARSEISVKMVYIRVTLK